VGVPKPIGLFFRAAPLSSPTQQIRNQLEAEALKPVIKEQGGEVLG
jgi:hypothetical protein